MYKNDKFSNLLLHTQSTFFDKLAVFRLNFPPQLQLILHLLDPDPGANRKQIQCGSVSETRNFSILSKVILSIASINASHYGAASIYATHYDEVGFICPCTVRKDGAFFVTDNILPPLFSNSAPLL
jgi:hypothetical protein